MNINIQINFVLFHVYHIIYQNHDVISSEFLKIFNARTVYYSEYFIRIFVIVKLINFCESRLL